MASHPEPYALSLFPFSDLNDEDVLRLGGVDVPSSIDHLPSFEIISNLTALPNLSDFDLDVHFPQLIDSRYFEIPELSGIDDDEDDLFILHTNIRSLSLHHDELIYLSKIHKRGFDIIGVSETWDSIKDPIITNVKICGYNYFNSLSHTQNGGVGLYIRQSFITHPRIDLNHTSEDFEVVWVEIENDRYKNSLICCTYRHPNSDVMNLTEYFKTTLPKVATKNVFIMGDFNVNLLNYDSHNPSREFIDNFLSNSFLPTIHHPTRVTDNSTSIIDNIYTNTITAKITSGNILTHISDHYPQFLVMKNANIRHIKSATMKYDYSNFHENEFIDDFHQIDFSYLDSINSDANINYSKFFSDLTEVVNKNAPIIQCTKKEIKLRNKPWINKRIQKMMRLRDHIHRRLRKHKSDDTLKLYKEFRNRVTDELKKSKINYFQRYFSSNSHNMKKLWSGIKLIINHKGSASASITKIKDIKGHTTQDTVEIANILNSFFVNIADNITKTLPRNPKSPLNYLSNRREKSMFLSPVNVSEIENIISNLNPSKSVGPHSIPVKLLKILGPHISNSFTKLINQSFAQGIFPCKLKIAKIIALFKKGDPELPSNYRPISILPLFSKLYEKVMHKRLYSYFSSLSLIYPLQFGFQPNLSIEHALISMTETIKCTLDNGKFGCGVFIDLQKAFDTVNHDILLSKLEHYGVRGVVLEWFKSYLSGRRQYVVVNNTSSDVLPINCGVPQGSILGPLLFLIYINDLPNVSSKLKFYLFADDTNIYSESENLGSLLQCVNRELKYVKRWLDVNRLSLNIEKTNYIIFHSSSSSLGSTSGVKIGKDPIGRVKFIKFLGVLLDENVSWRYHLSELSKKLARTCGILFKSRHLLPTNVLVCLYNSLFVSFLSYGIVVWGQTFPSYIEPIFKLQKRAVRTISHLPVYSRSTPIFMNLQLLRVTEIFEMKLLTFVYDSVNRISPSCFHNLFKMNSSIHHHHTRQAYRGDLFQPQWNTISFGRRSISQLGPKLWNRLPFSLRSSSNGHTFKRKLKIHLLNH